MNGIGAHEVIIETPEHARTLATLPETRGRGRAVGVSRPHARPEERQALPLHPDFQESRRGGRSVARAPAFAIDRAAHRAQARARGGGRLPSTITTEKERCIFCDIIRQERESVARVIDENGRVHFAGAVRAAVSVRDLDPAESARFGVREQSNEGLQQPGQDARRTLWPGWKRCSTSRRTIS